MIVKFHPTLTPDKWSRQPVSRQLLNVASELFRAVDLLKSGNTELLLHSIERALELIDLTVEVCRNSSLRRELLRFRGYLAGIYINPKPEQRTFFQSIR